MATALEKLRSTNNYQLINLILQDQPGADRITPASRGSISKTLDDLLNGNSVTMNGFVSTLINRIGTTIVRSNSWSNPLKEFKSGKLEYGATIQEANVDLITATSYDVDADVLERDLFGQARPDVQVNYHTVNRRDKYKITVNRDLLYEAFLADGGLMSFVDAVLDAPQRSDEWDEFLLMTKLLPEYAERNGFFKIHVPDARSMEAGSSEAKQVLRELRAMAETLTFISPKYNAAHVNASVKRDDLIIFGTPEFFATVDVEALAGAFNMERMSMTGRQFTIPAEHFGIDGAQALVTSKDFFVVKDRLLENTTQDNPGGLYSNHFLHHWQIISASRFAPAVLLHTGVDDREPLVIRKPTTVSAITMSDYFTGENITVSTPIARGRLVQLAATLSDADGEVDGGISWELTGNEDPKTAVSKDGVLRIGGQEKAASVEVTARAAFVDPADPSADRVISAVRTITVDLTSPELPEWPNPDTEEVAPVTP